MRSLAASTEQWSSTRSRLLDVLVGLSMTTISVPESPHETLDQSSSSRHYQNALVAAWLTSYREKSESETS